MSTIFIILLKPLIAYEGNKIIISFIIPHIIYLVVIVASVEVIGDLFRIAGVSIDEIVTDEDSLDTAFAMFDQKI